MLSGTLALFELRSLIIFVVSSAENVTVGRRYLTSEGSELLFRSFSEYYLTVHCFMIMFFFRSFN